MIFMVKKRVVALLVGHGGIFRTQSGEDEIGVGAWTALGAFLNEPAHLIDFQMRQLAS